MTEEERDNWEVLNFKMESEGFDYCFRKYSNWGEIEDETFHTLRETYNQVASQLETYVAEKFQEAVNRDYE